MKLERDDYTVAWFCVVQPELMAAQEMLDLAHEPPLHPSPPGQGCARRFGEIGDHNIIIVSPPMGVMGETWAAGTAVYLRTTFPSLKVAMMVGVAGGAPGEAPDDPDVRLGDVIVGIPFGARPGVIQYDYTKKVQDGQVEENRVLNKPPDEWRTAVADVRNAHLRSIQESSFIKYLTDAIERNVGMKYPGADNDVLFPASYEHKGKDLCENTGCDRTIKKQRVTRVLADIPVVHFGLIGSANCVMKDALAREELRKKYNLLCFEMEGAGVIDLIPCIVIRGICDYSDSHKNKGWQPYAAAAAAAYAKELVQKLEIVPPHASQDSQWKVVRKRLADEMLRDIPTITKFVPRNAEMKSIEKHLLPQIPVGSPRLKKFILYGMDGMGKTSLAAEFTLRNRRRYSIVAWINGSTKNSVLQGFVRLAGLISKHQLPESTNSPNYLPLREVELSDSKCSEQIVKSVLDWLRLTSGCHPWLLVFDNIALDHQTSAPDPQAYDPLQFIPQDGSGSVLITTSLRRLESLGESLKLDCVNDVQAVQILEGSAGGVIEGAQNLVNRLARLPLALEEAGSFLRDTAMPIPEYLDFFESVWPYRMQDSRSEGIWAGWTRSIAQIEKVDPNATILLKLWSYLDPNDFCQDMLASLDSTKTYTPTWFKPLKNDGFAFYKAVILLSQHSLISKDGNKGNVIHPVLHRWCRGRTEGEEAREFARLAISIIASKLPREESASFWQAGVRLLPHALQIYLPCLDPGLLKSGTPGLRSSLMALDSVGQIFRVHNMLSHAQMIYERALRGCQLLGGDSYPGSVRVLNNLGLVYRMQRRFGDAARVYHQALKNLESLDKNATVSYNDWKYQATHNLTEVFYNQGDHTRAELMWTKTLKDLEESLDGEDRHISATALRMGRLKIEQDKLSEAGEMLCKAQDKSVEENEGPQTLELLVAFGDLYQRQKNYKDAELKYCQAKDGYLRIYGPGHSSGVHLMYRIATLQEVQKNIKKAEDSYKATLHQCYMSLEKGAPLTLSVLQRLGEICKQDGRNHKAAVYLLKAVQGHRANRKGQLQSLTLVEVEVTAMLAYVYDKQGKNDEAVRAYLQAKQGYENIAKLQDIPDDTILEVMLHMALLHVRQRKLDDAQKTCKEATVKYGKDNFDENSKMFLDMFKLYIHVLLEKGDRDGALKLLQKGGPACATANATAYGKSGLGRRI